MKVKVHVFRLGHFARSKIESESIFLIKYYIITIINFILERFSLYLTKPKNGFPIVFSNLARRGSRVFFQARKLIFSPNGLFHPTKQLWMGEKVIF